jgi:hypothetical protein
MVNAIPSLEEMYGPIVWRSFKPSNPSKLTACVYKDGELIRTVYHRFAQPDECSSTAGTAN